MRRHTPQNVVIIGGGISGLATAWWLHKAGVSVQVLERERIVGGTIRTVRKDGWLVEAGPNSALETTPLFRTLFSDLGIEGEVVYANENSKNRFILRSGMLHALPLSPGAFFRSRLWSTGGKLRLFKEPFVGRGTREESVAEFVVRRLGREFLDYAINPFVAGVFAGNPEELSVRAAFPKLYALEENYGGLIKGQIQGRRERRARAEQSKDRAKMFSFVQGMATLPAAFHRALNGSILTDVEVRRVAVRQKPGPPLFEVSGVSKRSPFTVRAACVVTAIPSALTAKLLAPMDKELCADLEGIPYPPVAEVFLGFKKADIGRKLDGFGFLIPAVERRSILGTIWSSALFPGRAPDGYEALTTFVGGSRQPELAGQTDERMIESVVRELSQIMGVRGAPVFARVTRWQRAIPQYVLGHLELMAKVGRLEHRVPGLFVSGNFRGGISVGDCVISSERIAAQVIDHLRRNTNS
jgi:oxygen-dependent protoporphyrinogen oxidase